MSDDIDKDVHEQIMGKCWHENPDDGVSNALYCKKCNSVLDGPLMACDPQGNKSKVKIFCPSYLDWSNYGPLLEKISKHDEFVIFVAKIVRDEMFTGIKWMEDVLLTPSRGLPLIHKFFCKGVGK
jgi:hypothetical protein